MADETLEAQLAKVAAEAGASVVVGAAGSEFRRGSALFATANGNVVELSLDPEIADAALSTPDTTPSPRGSGWIRLAPAAPAERDRDRASAWFLSAWRNTTR